MGKYSIGIDFGSLSARAVLMDVETGAIAASAVYPYPHGIYETALPDGTPLGPDSALQEAGDYWNALHALIPKVLSLAGAAGSEVTGIGLDVTSCTILPTTKEGVPLSSLPQFRSRPHAYVKMWKHHGGAPYVERIREMAEKRGEPWLLQFGGSISSEHYLPKVMQMATEDPELYGTAERIIEMGDWLTWHLCGREVRGYTAAAFKTFYSPENGDLSPDFLAALHPLLGDLNEKHPGEIVCGGDRAGCLSAEAAAWLGLPAGIPVSAPAVDAHVTLTGCHIAERGKLLLVIGTSTCAMLLSDVYREVEGISGVVKEGILPDLNAYEAGQSCVGDLFAWFTRTCVPPEYHAEAKEAGVSLHELLAQKAAQLKVGESGLVALDWWNGVRSTLMDFDLSGLLVGMTLRTTPEELYRAALEATAYGARRIIEALENAGVPIDSIYAAGGIPCKNPLLMQIYADVCGREVHLVEQEHTGALGSAILGAAAAESEEGFRILPALTRKYCREGGRVYRPIEENVRTYEQLYAVYRHLYDHFGKGDPIMKELKDIRLHGGTTPGSRA